MNPFHRQRGERRGAECFEKLQRRRSIAGNRQSEGAIYFRKRVETEARLGDHAERSPRTAVEAHQVESRNIFYHASAGADDISLAGHELEAEDEITDSPRAVGERTR